MCTARETNHELRWTEEGGDVIEFLFPSQIFTFSTTIDYRCSISAEPF
jgi:hypothetical protein